MPPPSAKPDCTELQKAIARLALNIGLREDMPDLKAITAEMQKHIPQITREEVVGSIVAATRAERRAAKDIDKKLADIKREARTDIRLRKAVADLQAHIAQGTAPPNGQQTATYTAEDIADLRKQRDALLEQLKGAEATRAEKVKADIAELQKHLDNATLPQPKPKPPPPGPDLAALLEQRAAMKERLRTSPPGMKKRWEREAATLDAKIKELERYAAAGTLPQPKPKNAPAPPPEVSALRARKDEVLKALRTSDAALAKRYSAQIERLTKQLEEPLTVPGDQPEPMHSREVQRLAYQRDRLRAEIRNRINDLKPRTFWSKAAEPLNLARSFMTSLDLSATFRQGGFLALGRPVAASRSLAASVKAWASPQAAHAIDTEIRNRPNAHLYDRYGLYLAEPDGSPSKQEEAFMSRLAGKIPGIAGSQRAYTTFLNKLRADVFDAMSETLTRNGEPTTAEGKAIANFINVATGRGSVPGKFAGAMPAMNTAFFAPRYVLSRFQLALGQPLTKGTWRTRKLIAAQYARYLAGLGVVYALGSMAGGEIEDDPRSSDFGKIRLGETRIDPLSGLAQSIVVTSRILSGKTKKLSGDVVPIRGPDRPFGQDGGAELLLRFLRSKASPVAGTALDLAQGEDLGGNPVTPGSAAVRLLVPLGAADILQILRAHDIPEGPAIALLAFLGMGASHYETRGATREPEPEPAPQPTPARPFP